MSGLASISEWSDDNFTAKKNETPFELFDRIDEAFAADFRINLDKILKGDMDAFLKFLEEKIERDTKAPIIKEDTGILPKKKRIEQLESEILDVQIPKFFDAIDKLPIKEAETKLNRFSRFLKRLFR